jgi:transformation/transcription domain-associated protein
LDSFTKLREHIKICLLSPTEVRAGLQLINSTNLDYFDARSRAELFRLKGETLQQLGLGDECNTAFSTALTVHSKQSCFI